MAEEKPKEDIKIEVKKIKVSNLKGGLRRCQK